MPTPNRLILRREPNKSFSLLGVVTDESKSQIAFLTLSGASQTTTRGGGILLVTEGSLSHFARLFPGRIADVFRESPLSVFEQALVDAPRGLTAANIKEKVSQAGVPLGDVDSAWASAKKQFDTHPDVTSKGTGSALKYEWTADRVSRLGAWLPANPSVPDVKPEITPIEVTEPLPASDTDVTPDDVPATEQLLLRVLQDALSDKAPASVGEVPRNVLTIGSALSDVPDKTLRELTEVPEDQRPIVELLMRARSKQLRLWRSEGTGLSPHVVAAALESAIGEARRDRDAAPVLARFASRALQEVNAAELPFALVAQSFVRSAASESGSKPSSDLKNIAAALALRTKTSVRHDWVESEQLVAEVSVGMNRLALDTDGPRSQFLAALYQVAREHLEEDVLWKNVDVAGLDRAAEGPLRRALLDPIIEDRVVKPHIARLVAECRSRSALGQVLALRGAFAAHVDAAAVVAAMDRVASEDPKAREWLRGLSQQDRLDGVVAERDKAQAETASALAALEDARTRLAALERELDSSRAAIQERRASSEQAREAANRQAKLDVLKSLANLAATITASQALQQDPTLLQRVEFALRREGLTAIAAPGDIAAYDPAQHDAEGEPIDPGTPVSVGRAGYTYDQGETSLVLVKAQVSTTQEQM